MRLFLNVIMYDIVICNHGKQFERGGGVLDKIKEKGGGVLINKLSVGEREYYSGYQSS